MFSSSFRALVLLSVAVQVAVALPAGTTLPTRHATYAKRELPEGRTLSTYHPPSKFEVYGRSGIQRRGLASSNGDFKAAGLQFVKSKFGAAATDDEMDIVSEYKTSHGSHVWVSQNYKGIPIANTLANVALNNKGDVLSYSSSLVDFKKSSSFVSGGGYKTESKLTADDATLSALKHLGGDIADAKHAPTLQFFAVEDGSLKLTHAVRLTTAKNHLLDAFVDAESGDLRGVMDYTFELSARVVPITARNPEEAYELLENIENLDVSPLGWLNAAKTNYTSSLGNNGVVGQFDPDTLGSYKDAVQFTTNMTGDNVFDYTYDSSKAPTEGNNVNAANVNAFYVTNMAHDILYRYGFTEKTGNFQYQTTSDAKAAPDMLLTRVHDPTDEDNASFTSPPDGVPPLMRLHLFTATTPGRDSALENDVSPLHFVFNWTPVLNKSARSFSTSLRTDSNRLTGGGTARCLESVESRGLGEGWSDAFSNWVWQTGSPKTVRDFATGTWILGNTGGVRSHPYSLDQTVNPLKYGDVAGKEEEHIIGEVWAQALHLALGKLVETVGSSADALTNADGEGGHAVFMRLLVDALAIQPCNPTFTDARSAWIQADEVRYGGKHKCALWTAFAAAGLGDGAAGFINSDKIPADACSTSCKARKARA